MTTPWAAHGDPANTLHPHPCAANQGQLLPPCCITLYDSSLWYLLFFVHYFYVTHICFPPLERKSLKSRNSVCSSLLYFCRRKHWKTQVLSKCSLSGYRHAQMISCGERSIPSHIPLGIQGPTCLQWVQSLHPSIVSKGAKNSDNRHIPVMDRRMGKNSSRGDDKKVDRMGNPGKFSKHTATTLSASVQR